MLYPIAQGSAGWLHPVAIQQASYRRLWALHLWRNHCFSTSPLQFAFAINVLYTLKVVPFNYSSWHLSNLYFNYGSNVLNMYPKATR